MGDFVHRVCISVNLVYTRWWGTSPHRKENIIMDLAVREAHPDIAKAIAQPQGV